MKHNAGFTLVEILTAVIIVTILVAMAVPLYEKTVERSRLAEARSILAKLEDAKLYAMDNMGCSSYNVSNARCPRLRHLNIAFTSGNGQYSFLTKDFAYTINVTSHPEGVCAKRLTGDNAGTLFVYRSAEVASNEPSFICKGSRCSEYGLNNANETVTCEF